MHDELGSGAANQSGNRLLAPLTPPVVGFQFPYDGRTRTNRCAKRCTILASAVCELTSHDGKRASSRRRTALPIRTAVRKFLFLMIISAGIAGVSLPRTCRAEDFTATDVLEDTKLYFTAPVRWDAKDWLYFGGVLAAIGAAHAYDGDVRRHFAVGDRAILNGQDRNSSRDALPAVVTFAGTWAFAELFGDSAGKVEAYTMLEAGGFSLVTTEVLKVAAGRERPDATTRVNDWRQGGTSFPSLHASAAFAVGTVLAESGGDEFRWIRRILGYGMAGATAYVRLHENVHWLSDTVAGAAIGISTADFTMNRRKARAHRWDLSVEPMEGGGTQVALTMQLH